MRLVCRVYDQLIVGSVLVDDDVNRPSAAPAEHQAAGVRYRMTIDRDFLAIQQDGFDIVFSDAAIEHALDRVNPVYELQFELAKPLIGFSMLLLRACCDVGASLRSKHRFSVTRRLEEDHPAVHAWDACNLSLVSDAHRAPKRRLT